MLFNSPAFLFLFLPFALIGGIFLPKKYRNYFLLLASLFFYAWSGGLFVFLIIFSILANYLFGILINKFEKKSKLIISLGICFNLSLLIFYKYANFLANNLNINLKEILIPIGISFFTFHAISYLIDIYRKKIPAQKNIFHFGLYMSFFPQMIAGPIIRYKDIAEQLTKRTVDAEKFAYGVKRFILGLAKKVLIADVVASVADSAFSASQRQLSMETAWIGIICYALQIYFDFSGYSDMAIGLGRMFGFTFLENFNLPYISKSIREFWQRWHISLSNWFKDYLYIPLGGNRISEARTYFNLFVVFLLCGLWHGANWTFIVFGIWHGLFMIFERMKFGKILEKIWSPVRVLYSLLVISIGWVFFRSASISKAFLYLKSMFTFSYGNLSLFQTTLNNFTIFMIIAGILISAGLFQKISEKLNKKNPKTFAVSELVFYTALAVLAFASMSGSTYSPFIYFKF